MSRIYYYLFIIGFLWTVTTLRDRRPHHSKEDQRKYEKEWWGKYNNMTFEGNGTYVDAPEPVHDAVGGVLATTELDGVYYKNITGIYHGAWNALYVYGSKGLWNGTAPEGFGRPDNDTAGVVTLTLDQKDFRDSSEPKNANISSSFVFGIAKIHSGSFTERMRVQGVYWRHNGTLLAYSAAEESLSNPVDLVKGMPDELHFNDSKALLGRVYEDDLNGRLRPDEVERDCEYFLAIQFEPVPLPRDKLDEIEHELENPSGKSIGKVPELVARVVMFSPECGVLLDGRETEKTSGIRLEAYLTKASNFALMSFIVGLAQTILVIRQIEYTSAPSSAAKVSLYTVATLTIIDVYVFMIYSNGWLVYRELYLAFTGASFITMALIGIFDMRYLMAIWNVQRAESATTEEARVWLVRTHTFGLYVMILIGYLVLYMFFEDVRPAANTLIWILMVAVYSYWIPQIYRNTKRGTSRGLRHEYLVGTTMLKLFYPVYAFGYTGNVAFIKATKGTQALVVYNLLQMMILLAQDMFGPRFFLPSFLIPASYNYHPVLPPADEESQQDDEAALADDWEHNASSASNRTCAVCMQHVEVGHATGIGRSAYMVTPCHHIFHSECLERWMEIKLECPVCRAPLPPI